MRTGRPTARGGVWLAVACVAAATLWSGPVLAFGLEGHEIIEASAYKRLLALDVVPGTTAPAVSGRTLLATLISAGFLREPPCFDRAHPKGDCGAAARLDLPLRYWPYIGSGAPDLVLDRQLGQQGQCQHFMARTDDGLTPVDPRFGAPLALETTAYARCANIAGLVLDGILRNPYVAHERVVGTYVLMHAIEDSFSAAHVDRDESSKIVHLLSWTLIDWPEYALRGHAHFPPETHHAVTDKRDLEYIQWEQHAKDGRACDSFHNPYAYPEECLTDRARAATDAIVDLLVVTYRLYVSAATRGQRPSLLTSASTEDAALWTRYLQTHLASVAEPPPRLTQPSGPDPRDLHNPDAFVGALGTLGSHSQGLGLWGTQFYVGPAVPFVLGVTGAASVNHVNDSSRLVGSIGLNLVLPLVRRFAIGGSPAAFRVTCDTDFKSCGTDISATLGVLIIPLGESTWLGVEGPTWSWTTRTVGDALIGVAFGWSHERDLDAHPPAREAVATWDPPAPEEVHAFRLTRSTRAAYLAATVVSGDVNQFMGVGIEWRRDRDEWNRRHGLAPGLQLEVDQGRIEGRDRGGVVAVAPTLRDYLMADRLAVSVTPALVRVGDLAGHAVGVDVAARAGLVIDLGKLEIAFDSPPLSYVSRERRHALPFTMRLGLMLD